MGPTGRYTFKLALDTGATDTMVNAQYLSDIGYDLALFPTVSMGTASGTIQAPDLAVSRVEALGQTRLDFPILAHTLPPTAVVLGLDFRRG